MVWLHTRLGEKKEVSNLSQCVHNEVHILWGTVLFFIIFGPIAEVLVCWQLEMILLERSQMVELFKRDHVRRCNATPWSSVSLELICRSLQASTFKGRYLALFPIPCLAFLQQWWTFFREAFFHWSRVHIFAALVLHIKCYLSISSMSFPVRLFGFDVNES